MKFHILLAALVFSCSTSFADWAQDFEELKDIPRSYEDAGAICEEVARLDMQREYPAPQYKVEVGIAYNDGKRTIGELDIVIFDTNLNKAIKVAEVKCWKDMRAGLRKAMDQRSRFIKYNRSGLPIFFRSTSTTDKFEQAQFNHVQEFFSIAQKGSTSQGYEVELDYTLKQLHSYRVQMLNCQKQGVCAKPTKP